MNTYEKFPSITTIIDKITEITAPIVHIAKDGLIKLQNSYKKLLTTTIQNLRDTLEECRNNPDSLLSWMDYRKMMKDVFWIYPYKIEPNELKNILKQNLNEKDFDKYMKKHFKKNIVEELANETLKLMQKNHQTMYRQAINAYFEKSYSLCNNGLISIIDDLTSYFMSDKGASARKGLFVPIVNEIYSLDTNKLKTAHFILMMISENIDMLYTNTDFNSNIKPNNAKGINRHSTIHGKYYSNKKESSLMLLNTIYYLLQTIKNFKQFKNKLKYDKKNKQFEIILPIPNINFKNKKDT